MRGCGSASVAGGLGGWLWQMVLLRRCEMVPGLGSRFGRRSRRSSKKSARPVTLVLQGSVGSRWMSGPPGHQLYWSMIRRVGAPSRAAKNFKSSRASPTSPCLNTRSVLSADRRASEPAPSHALVSKLFPLYPNAHLHDEIALNLRTVATDTTSVVRDQNCQLSDNHFSLLDFTASFHLNLVAFADFLTGIIIDLGGISAEDGAITALPASVRVPAAGARVFVTCWLCIPPIL